MNMIGSLGGNKLLVVVLTVLVKCGQSLPPNGQNAHVLTCSSSKHAAGSAPSRTNAWVYSLFVPLNE